MADPGDPALPSRADRRRPLSLWLLAAVMAVLFLGGLSGAWMFLAHPDGRGIGMEATLARLPVDSFVLPGLFLPLVMSLLPALLIAGMLSRSDWPWLEPLAQATGMRGSWVCAVALGIGIGIWLGIQGFFIGFAAPAQRFTALIGAGILLCALAPSTRRAMRGRRRPSG